MNFRPDKLRDCADMLGCLVAADNQPPQAAMLLKKQFPWITKSDVSATADGDLAGEFSVVLGGLVLAATENGPGVYDVIKRATRRATFNSPLFIGSGPLVATVTGAGASFPVVHYGVDSAGLSPAKVGALVAITNDALRTEQGREGLITDLVQGVGLATDAKFLSLIGDDAAPISATDDPMADFKLLLDGVNQSGFGRLFLIVSPATANALATWREGGILQFPDLGPQGGSILQVPVLVTAAAGDSAYLVDARGLVTGDEDLRVTLSTNASVEMSDSPTMDSATPAAATGKLVSMFQTETTAAIGMRSFAAKLLRPTAAALLEGITWQGSAETT